MAIVDASSGTESPATRGYAITPGDGTDLSFATRAVWVGGAGDLTVTLLGGDTVTLSAIPAGTLIPIRAKQVAATGTTATLIVGLY